jgi:hypothetical protein
VESSNPRWRLRCSACGAGGVIGPNDGWCEACQLGVAGAEPALCPRCGGPLSREAPRFIEAFGAIQELASVVEAWRGNPTPLRALLPERPRFLSDLTPPAVRGGDTELALAALASLSDGSFRQARPRAEAWCDAAPDEPRAWTARAIAAERLGDTAEAERAWGDRLARGEDPRARLARGALRARRGATDEAREDFDHAGEGPEARWNRAALDLIEAVAVTPGLPAPERIAAAREASGWTSDYWSDPSIGRLLWSLLVERAEARRRAGSSECPDARVLRAAESELEHDTFWDRAMVIAGYCLLGMKAETAAAAGPLAGEHVEALSAAPFLRARGAAALRDEIESARAAIAAHEPGLAARALARLLARDDLRQYAVPCEACGRGSLRAEAIEDEG